MAFPNFAFSLFTILSLHIHIAGVFGWSDFEWKVTQQGNAQNKAFHDSILKQLSDSRFKSITQSTSQLSTFLNFDSPAQPTGIVGDIPVNLATASSFADNATESFHIYMNDTLPINPSPSSGCATALTRSIACNSTIPLMAISPYIFLDDLSDVCTTDCAQSLASYRAGVVSACGSYQISDSGNISYAPTLAVDYVLGPYTVQCLRDPQTQDFCGPEVQSFNASGGLSALPKSQLCTYCTLETLNATLSNPVTFSSPVETLLLSAIATCGSAFDSYNVSFSPGNQAVLAPGVPSFGVNSTSNFTADCALVGRNITVSSATTCSAVAANNSVSEYSVFTSNPFLTSDCNITAGTTLCIPKACTTYTVALNDTCDSVAAMAGNVTGTAITSIQLQSFNPDLGTYCQLMALRVGKLICLTPNGGFPNVGATSAGNPSATPTMLALIPTPTMVGTTSKCGKYYQVQAGDICQTVALSNGVALADFLTLNPEIDVNCTNLWLDYYYCVAPFPPFASVTATPTITTNYSSATVFTFTLPTNYTATFDTVPLTPAGVAAPTNVADGTRTVACGDYYDIADGDTVNSVATLVGINATELQAWNPEISSGSLPSVGSAICVVFPHGNYTLIPLPRPANAYANATAACAEYYTVQNGDGCPLIQDKFALNSAQLTELNPGLKTDCSNLIAGLAYCVFPIFPLSDMNTGSGPPGNVAPGTITNGCTQYYTVVANDTCSLIETKFNLTSVQFQTYNPEIASDCSNIQAGLAYCVASNATAPSGGGGAPGNLAAGSFSNCTTYHTVVSGDNCPILETTYKIAAVDFFRWNPEVSTDCINILAGEAYCVQGGGMACAKLYTVQSGDSCFAITQSQGISQANLQALDPFLGSSCSLIPGENLCLQAATTGPPSNIATGTFTNCTTYHTVVSGDQCPAIETNFNIAAADLFRWNPEINVGCTNILVGEAYCVGGGGKQCAKIYTVKSGDSCFAITQSQNVTQTQINTLNPFLGTDCSLVPGENLCVG